MNFKASFLALATVAALGAAALTSTSAEAASFHRGGGKGFHGGGVHRPIAINRPIGVRPVPTLPGRHIHRWPGHRHVHHIHWRHRHVYYPRPVVYAAAPAVYAAPTIYRAAPVVYTNRCTCLTKEYTPEGAVLFKDICTNEAAINPPPAPVQTGYAPQPGAPVAQ